MSTVDTEHVAAMIRETGARVTRPRVAVLAVLLASKHALSHHEVGRRVDRALGVDRVTIYRVLDWLSEAGLAHKVAGDDRVRRYNAAERAHDRAHAHFQCNRCGTVICLDEPSSRRHIPLPAGYTFQEVELTVKGVCSGCAAGRRRAAQPTH